MAETRICPAICALSDNAPLFRTNRRVGNLDECLRDIRSLWLLDLYLPQIVIILTLAAAITAQVVVMVPACIFSSIFCKFINNV